LLQAAGGQSNGSSSTSPFLSLSRPSQISGVLVAAAGISVAVPGKLRADAVSFNVRVWSETQ
jgi:hypothetical protein